MSTISGNAYICHSQLSDPMQNWARKRNPKYLTHALPEPEIRF